MIFNTSDHNPLPIIKSKAEQMGKKFPYNRYFIDFVRKELFLGGVVPETDEEFDEVLVLLVNMEII